MESGEWKVEATHHTESLVPYEESRATEEAHRAYAGTSADRQLGRRGGRRERA